MKRMISIGISALFLLSGCSGKPCIDPALILPAWEAASLSENIYIGTVVSIDTDSYVKFEQGENEPGWDFVQVEVRVEESLKGDIQVNNDVLAELPVRYLDWIEEGQLYLFFAVPVPDGEIVPSGYTDFNPWWAVHITDTGGLKNPDWDRLVSEGYYVSGSPPACVEDVREIIRTQ